MWRRGILFRLHTGVHFGEAGDARGPARHVDESAAELAERRTGRFGFFATLTLPNVDGAIAEAEYAFDELHADGVILLANIDGQYLSEQPFDPLLAELDRRNAVVFVHPANLPGPAADGVPPYIACWTPPAQR